MLDEEGEEKGNKRVNANQKRQGKNREGGLSMRI